MHSWFGWPPTIRRGATRGFKAPEERGPSRGPVDDCAHPEGGGHPSRPTAPDGVAHVPPSALAGARGGGLLHDGGLDCAGTRDVHTAFVIELHTRRVSVLGSTRHPDGAFVVQAMRGLVSETEAILCEGRILLCDRDANWTSAMESVLSTVGVRVVRTPPASPNCNAHAERFVRSIKEECLNRVLPLGEWHLRRVVREYVTHYQTERNHQGIGNALIDRPPPQPAVGPIRRRQRVGGILSYYYRAA